MVMATIYKNSIYWKKLCLLAISLKASSSTSEYIMQRFKMKNKVCIKYEDFYSSEDLKDSDTSQRINLTIEDFDAKGQVANPRAPCVVSTIDPDYAKDAALQRTTKKFRIKTDILRLREITRKKFVIYATKESYLEKKRDIELQEHIFKHITDLQEYAADSLCRMESSAFNELKLAQKELSELQYVKINDEFKNTIAEHQRVLMEVQEVYGRFLFMLKLIGYFDEIISPEDIYDNDDKQGCTLSQLADTFCLQINVCTPMGNNEICNIVAYMDNTVRPYLSKRNHLNADIWIKGYERTRQKIFNFNRRFTNVSLLNHLVSVVDDKSKKTFERCAEKQMFLLDPKFLANRMKFLMKRSLQILTDFERCQKKDKLQLKLNAILPVILQRIEFKMSEGYDIEVARSSDKVKKNKLKSISIAAVDTKSASSGNSTKFFDNQNNSTLAYVEELQWHLLVLSLLQGLEKYHPQRCKLIEIHVRKRLQMQKEASRRSLVKQTRLRNWMEHFKKHDSLRQKDCSC